MEERGWWLLSLPIPWRFPADASTAGGDATESDERSVGVARAAFPRMISAKSWRTVLRRGVASPFPAPRVEAVEVVAPASVAEVATVGVVDVALPDAAVSNAELRRIGVLGADVSVDDASKRDSECSVVAIVSRDLQDVRVFRLRREC